MRTTERRVHCVKTDVGGGGVGMLEFRATVAGGMCGGSLGFLRF